MQKTIQNKVGVGTPQAAKFYQKNLNVMVKQYKALNLDANFKKIYGRRINKMISDAKADAKRGGDQTNY